MYISRALPVHDIFAKPAGALQHIRGDLNASVLGIQEVAQLMEEQFAPALTNCEALRSRLNNQPIYCVVTTFQPQSLVFPGRDRGRIG